MSKEQTSLNTIPEDEYLSDAIESARVNDEQKRHAGYRQPLDHLASFASVGAEGSWINRKHRKK